MNRLTGLLLILAALLSGCAAAVASNPDGRDQATHAGDRARETQAGGGGGGY
jgi:hypothetical protein